MVSKIASIAQCAAPVSAETVAVLEQMLAHAKNGEVNGIAIVALRLRGNYEIKLRGSAADPGNNMAVAGMLAALQKMALDLGS
jgi:hypothetical protein